MDLKKQSVVVIGGGTGTHTILRGLKRYSNKLNITAIVTMADSGGSTGRLRDEFGMLPIGDARMALAALANDGEHSELLMRELFLYRFNGGTGLKGHNLGNLLLTALSDLLGNEAMAIAAASRILRIDGQVLPVTMDNVHLTAEYDDGKKVEGEHQIDDPNQDRAGRRIVKLGLNGPAEISPEAIFALSSADIIIIGPGDLYSSLLANCVVSGVSEAISESPAKFIYVANLMERFGQTEGMMASDCVKEIAKYVGRAPDIVLINNATLPADLVDSYFKKEGIRPVKDDLGDSGSPIVIRADLISREAQKQNTADQVTRSLIRHDSDKLAASILNLLQSG